MSLRLNLPKYREHQGLTQEQLAQLVGVKQSTVGMWENGTNSPRAKTLEKIAEILNVTVNDLMYSTNAEPFSYNTSRVIKIPIYGYIPAGVPMEAIEDIIDYEEAPEEWTIGGKEFFGLKIKGDSMEPEYRNGDIIIFLRQSDCENNEDCAVAINGDDWTFKRVEKMSNGILIKPLNPSYESRFFTSQECIELPVEVKGVFWELRRSKRK